MTLQELRYLVAVAEERHFGRAARRCHVTQPTLSAGIAKLEDELGSILLERGRRGILLRESAHEILPIARSVLAGAERIEQLARERAQPLAGALRLGIIPTVAPYLLPHFVSALHRAHPRLRLLLKEDTTNSLLSSLRAGELDLALMSPPVAEDGLGVQLLYEEPFVLAAPATHPLTRRQRLRPSDLREQPLLLLDEGHCLRDQTLDLCRTANSPVREVFRGASLETLRSMVAAGVGCTLMPRLAVAEASAESDPVQLRPFMKPIPHRIIALYWRRASGHERSAHGLADFIVEHLPPGVFPANA